jgi:hypothetical protein
MRRGPALVTDIILAVFGVAVFIAGDLISNRWLRAVGFIIVAVGLVTAAILAAFPRDDHWTPPDAN